MTYVQQGKFGSTPFRDILRAIDAQATSERYKGDQFKQLTKAFFERDFLYLYEGHGP